MNTILEIKKIVKAECLKPTSHYGFEPYSYHFIPMVKYSKKLALILGADTETVEIAAWLHDIGSIMYGRKDHHITGAKEAKKILIRLSYPPHKLERVVECIKNHRSSTASKCVSIEEKIISDADAISNFDNLAGLFKAAFIYEDMNQGQAAKSISDKLTRKWKKLFFKQSQDIIIKKYDAAMILLEKDE